MTLRPLSRGRARPQLDAELARGARAGADERLLVLQALREARIHGLVHQARGLQVAEQVPAEDALRQRHLTGADGQVDLPRVRELLADLVAGVAAAHHQHRARREVVRGAVPGAVQLHHLGPEAGGDRRRERHLKRPRGDDDLVGLVGAVGELDDEAAAVTCPHGLHAAVELDRQLEPSRVVGEVGDDVVAPRVAVGVAWEVEPGQAVVAHGREQPQRVPAAPPRRGRLAGRFEDGEPPALLGEVVADRQAGLAAADDDDVVVLGSHATACASAEAL